MKYALITGTSSGIGLELCKQLLTEPSATWEIYGLCRHPERFTEQMNLSGFPPDVLSRYHPITCDLTDYKQLQTCVRQVLSCCEPDLLVNNAGVGYFGPHEEISAEHLHSMIAVNLEAPLLLTQLLLRTLKKTKGTILNLSSVTARQTGNTHGCAYGATKAALTSFGNSLFEEVRKYGVRVITLQPDLTESSFYEEANFTTDSDMDCHLSSSEVATLACSLLSLRDGSLVTEVTLRPQKHRISRK